MKLRSFSTLIFCVGLAAAAAAQGKPPAPPPPPGGPPGTHGPGGPGGPPNGPPPSGPPPGAPANASGNAQNFGPVGRWWDDKAVVQHIGISHDQQKKMDVIFDANKPAILGAYKTFLAEQAKLDALGKQPQVDQTKMFAAIDAVSQARAALQKANTQMLLQIRQQMAQDQIEKLEKLK